MDGQPPQRLAVLKQSVKKVPSAVWATLGIVVMVAVVAGLARAASPPSTQLTGKSLASARELLQSAKQLAKQAAQDVDARQRHRDIDTGLAYIAAARFLAPDSVLEQRCAVKVDELYATFKALDTGHP